MNKKEQIEEQYRLLGLAINWRGPDKHNQLKCIRRHLDAIRELSEPETLTSEAFREVNVQLSRKNHELEQELDITLSSNATLRNDLNMADSHIEELQLDLERKNQVLERAHSELTWFKVGCVDLEKELGTLKLVGTANQHYIEDLRKKLEMAKERIKTLERRLAINEKYIGMLQNDRRHYS